MMTVLADVDTQLGWYKVEWLGSSTAPGWRRSCRFWMGGLSLGWWSCEVVRLYFILICTRVQRAVHV